jgi:WD40 repeat protein
MLALEGHADPVHALAFSPDGRTLASASSDRTVRLWQGARPTLQLDGHTGPIRCLAFRADGRVLASGGDQDDRSVWVWDIDPDSPAFGTGRKVLDLGYHNLSVTGLTFEPTGAGLYIAAGDRVWPDKTGTVKRLDLTTGRFTDLVSPASRLSNVLAMDLAPDGHTLAWGHSGPGIALRDIRRPSPTLELQRLPKGPLALRFSPDGTLLAAAVDYTVKLFDRARRHKLATLTGHKGLVLALAFSPDGRTLASGSRDGTVRFWDVAGRRERAVFPWPVGAVGAVTFAPDGLRAAAAGEQGPIFLWDIDEA